MNEWMPIETAPTDGTTVLLAVQYSDMPLIGRWVAGSWSADTEHYAVYCGAWCLGGSPVLADHTVCTHWQPLPESP